MSFSPGYGETPLDGDELDALLPLTRQALGESPSKAEVYDLEQAIQDDVAHDLTTSVLTSMISLSDLLTDHFLRDLHRRLYEDIWTWAGVFRFRELAQGVAPELLTSELRESLDTISYRWRSTSDWTPKQLGIAVHAETVRIHPFTDGNGRATRLLADLVFAAAQDGPDVYLYDWAVDKRTYIALLRAYDQHRDVTDLADFVGVRSLGE